MICALLRAYITENSFCALETMRALERRDLVIPGKTQRTKHGFPEYQIIFTPKGLQLAQEMIRTLAAEYENFTYGA